MRFRAASDRALLVYLGEGIGLAAHEHVVRLLRQLQVEPLPWVQNLQPAYCSLLVSFDARKIDHAQAEATIREYERRAENSPLPEPRHIDIPVCYGGNFGPDLEDVAALHGLKPERVMEIHSSRSYHAYFLGFTPGFAYLGDLNEDIAIPRLDTPRKKVVAGSVGIAGKQTAIYPFASPGGWRLVGRTPVSVFCQDRNPMELIAVGDRVRFFPITQAEFMNWEKS